MPDHIIVLSYDDVAALMAAIADVEQNEVTDDTRETLSRIASDIDQQVQGQ